jgi:arabinose-5-phosphate isomerase
VAVTSRADSSLARAADIVLELPVAREACPHGLAPTTSTAMQMALGDALAVALLESRGFTALDFRVFHPGGRLGANLRHVRDLMHGGDAVPLVDVGRPMGEAVLRMTEKGFGCVGVTEGGRLVGIVTDGDLRRHMADDLLGLPVEAVMTPAPKTVSPDALASEALELVNRLKITALLVVEGPRPVGIVHVHDLLRVGVA